MKAGINRRQFMQKSLVGAAAAPLVTHVLGHEAEAFTQPVSLNDRIQVGLVGVGAISTQHFEAIDALSSTRLVAVASASAERARATGEAQGVPWTTRLEELLDRDDVDAVTV